ncbi:hypothetical protein [Streptococcus sp. FT1-55]|uniref:hypothetical protein n=1 Tax=Streptococcus sp. FT1-55 TaxID=3409805 RepID=UPI003BF50EC0
MTKELTPTQVEELKQALKDKNNAPHHRKIQALILYSECHNLTSVAKSVGFVHQTVRNLLNRYLSGGVRLLVQFSKVSASLETTSLFYQTSSNLSTTFFNFFSSLNSQSKF